MYIGIYIYIVSQILSFVNFLPHAKGPGQMPGTPPPFGCLLGIPLRKRLLQFLAARNAEQRAVAQHDRSLLCGMLDQLVHFPIQGPPVVSEDNQRGVCVFVSPHMNGFSFLAEDQGQVDDFCVAHALALALSVFLVVPSCEGIPAVVPVVRPVVPGENAANDGSDKAQEQRNQPSADLEGLGQCIKDDAGVRDGKRSQEGGSRRAGSLNPTRNDVAGEPDSAQDADGREDAQNPVPAQAEHNQRHDSANQSQYVTQCYKLFHDVFSFTMCLVCAVGLVYMGVYERIIPFSIISHLLFFVNFLHQTAFRGIKN